MKWIDQIFEADQTTKGGVVRRNKADVQKMCSLDDLLDEVRLRKFHLMETGDQYIIVCNTGALQLHC